MFLEVIDAILADVTVVKQEEGALADCNVGAVVCRSD